MNTNSIKALGRKVLGHVLIMAAATGIAPRLYAEGNPLNQMGQQAAGLYTSDSRFGGTPPTVAVATTPVEMVLSYTGPSSAAYVTIGISSIQFFAPFGVVDTSIGGTSFGSTGGTVDLTVSSTGLTMGALCDYINGVVGTLGVNTSASGSRYHCALKDGIRSDPPNTTAGVVGYLPNVVETAGTNELHGLSTVTAMGYAVPIASATILSLGIIPAPNHHVQLVSCFVNMSTGAAAVPLQVYGSLAKYGIGSTGYNTFGVPQTDATLVWSGPPLASTTNTQEPGHLTTYAYPDQAWLEFGGNAFTYATSAGVTKAQWPVAYQNNGHVVVRANAYSLGTALTTSTQMLTCSWIEKLNQ